MTINKRTIVGPLCFGVLFVQFNEINCGFRQNSVHPRDPAQTTPASDRGDPDHPGNIPAPQRPSGGQEIQPVWHPTEI